METHLSAGDGEVDSGECSTPVYSYCLPLDEAPIWKGWSQSDTRGEWCYTEIKHLPDRLDTAREELSNSKFIFATQFYI